MGDLATLRREAADRYAAIGAAWFDEFRVTLAFPTSGLHGYALVAERKVAAPMPATTRKRLYILAHEIGHVVLGHSRQRPAYVREFEAEHFAHGLMRRDGLAVPRVMTNRAKAYVMSKIAMGFRSGGKWFDPDIAAWAGADFNWRAPPDKQRLYHDASRQRVRAALRQEPPGEETA